MHLDKRLSIQCSHVFNSRHLCGRWGATRPADECFAPTVAERRPEPWVQGSLRYNKRKPQVNHLRFLLLCGRWGAARPVDECFAPTVAERRPELWVQGSLRYNKRKPQVNHLRFLLLCGRWDLNPHALASTRT